MPHTPPRTPDPRALKADAAPGLQQPASSPPHPSHPAGATLQRVFWDIVEQVTAQVAPRADVDAADDLVLTVHEAMQAAAQELDRLLDAHRQTEWQLEQQSRAMRSVTRVLQTVFQYEREEDAAQEWLVAALVLLRCRVVTIGSCGEGDAPVEAMSNTPDGVFVRRQLPQVPPSLLEPLRWGEAIHADPQSRPDVRRLFASEPPREDALVVPLMEGEHLLGYLALGDRGGGFDRGHEDAALTLAGAITEAWVLLRTKDTLRTSQRQLATVIRAARDAIVMVQADGAVSFWNPAAEKLFGYAEREVLGRNLHEFIVPAERREAARRGMERFSSTGRGMILGDVVEMTALCRDGTTLPVEVSVARARAEEGWQAVGIVRDVSERKRREDELERSRRSLRELAMRDALTGLFNRRHFFDRQRATLAAAARHGFPVTFCLVDVDNFKEINDSFGHLVGDRVLAEIASALQAGVREEDLVARFGGDEFCILFAHSDGEASRLAAERLRLAVKRIQVRAPRGRVVRVSATFGLATADRSIQGDALFRAADEALYQAKRRGRDRVVLHGDDGGLTVLDGGQGEVA